MLKEGFDMRSDEGMEELEEVQQELKQKDEERERSAGDVESGPVRASDKIRKCISPVFIQGKIMKNTNGVKYRLIFSFHHDILGRMGRP